MINKETFKAIKWFTGDSYYDGQTDYLHILSNKRFLSRIIASYLEYTSATQPEADSEMLQKC